MNLTFPHPCVLRGSRANSAHAVFGKLSFGAVRFAANADIAELYTCDCSICRKRNALMTNVHESALTLLAGADKLTLYQWSALPQ